MTNRSFFLAMMLSLAVSSATQARPRNAEEIPANEPDEIKAILDLVRLGYEAEQKKLEEGKITEVNRDAHGKHHGCLKGRLDVKAGLPGLLRQGIFAYEPGETPPSYPAWIRMSNGSKEIQGDWMPDGRGMAVKLTKVTKGGPKLLADEKETQDFLTINNEEFFIKNAEEYHAFMLDRKGFFATRPKELAIAMATASKFVTSPLTQNYFSMAPISLGERYIKYSFQPCPKKVENGEDKPEAPKLQWGDLDLTPMAKILSSVKDPRELAQHVAALRPFDHYLTTTLARHVAGEEVCYKLLVQFQKDPVKHDVEDARSDWRDAKFLEVATLTIEKQTIAEKYKDENFKARNEFCENLALTPWHTIAAHTPRGGIQRLRKPVYELSSALRHEYNGAKQVEPTGEEKF